MALPVSHTVPSYPVSEQLQLKAPSKSSHRPLCWHGDDWHSSISASQFNPVYPLAQIHEYSLIPSVHVPEFRHGLLVHSSMLVWQFTPVYPVEQLHLYILIPSIHVLLWRHGLLWQSLMLVWQLIPVYPAVQVHWYEPGVFLQDAPLRQNEALVLHSLTSVQDYSWTQYRYIHFCSSLHVFNCDISFRNFAFSYSIFLEPISSFCIPSGLNHTSPIYEPEYDKTGPGVQIWRRKKHFHCNLSLNTLLCKVSWWVEVSNRGKIRPISVVFSLLMSICKLRNEMYCIYTC